MLYDPAKPVWEKADDTSRRPTLFIGSSRTSLPAAQALKAGLSGIVDATVWSDLVDFQSPGALFPALLLQQPEKFDFAVMILGPDDRILTDEGTFNVPRDNVIFELGLFMAHLGPERTFMVAPGGDTKVKILSDLSGMVRMEYEPPSGMGGVIDKISRAIERNCRRKVLAYDGPPSVFEFRAALLSEANRLWQQKKHVTVWNFALDMSATWDPLYEALSRPEIRDLTWRSVMLDPEFPTFKEIESESVRVDRAKANIGLIQGFCSRHRDELAKRNVTVECRTYRSIPLIHGFLVNGAFLFFTLLTPTENGPTTAVKLRTPLAWLKLPVPPVTVSVP